MTAEDVRPQPAGQDADPGFMETPYKHPKVRSVLEQQGLPICKGNMQVRGCPADADMWNSSLSDILHDHESSEIFYQYLETEHNSVIFDLWKECQNYKACPPNKATAKTIQARYLRVKDVRVPVSDQARNNLAIRIRSNNVDDDLLEEIELEVYQSLRDVWYIRFLKSDFLKCFSDQYSRNLGSSTDTCLKPGCADRKLAYSSQMPSHPPEDVDSRLFDNRLPYLTTKDVDAIGSDGISLCHHDELPNPKDFRPRTHRMSKEKAMPPAEFARVLSEKLMKVLREQCAQESSEENCDSRGENPGGIHVLCPSHLSYHAPPLPSGAASDCSSYFPCDGRSVAGQSSHSGSGALSQVDTLIYKESAKELMKSVKRHLKGTMLGCKCQTCVDSCRSLSGSSYAGMGPGARDPCVPLYNQESALSQRLFSPQVLSTCSANSTAYTGNFQAALDPEIPSLESSKILQWMEKSSQYSQHNYLDPSPSPGHIRKTTRQPLFYSNPLQSTQPIATDPGMPPLPPPNTSTVLEEVNRRLQSGSGSSSQPGTMRIPDKSTAAYYQGGAHGDLYGHVYPTGHNNSLLTGSHPNGYADYERQSSIGENSQWSDSRSSVSFNAARSEISSAPSSASRMWHVDAGSEFHGDYWVDEARSVSLSDNHYGSARVACDAQSSHHSEPRSLNKSHAQGLRHEAMRAPARDQERTRVPDLLRSDGRCENFSESSAGRSAGSGSSKSQLRNSTTVTYYFCGDPIPFRISVPSREVTLAHFKEQTKKGNFSYFFKTLSEDDGEVVFLEVKNDLDFLPRYDDKIVGKIIKNE